MSIADASQSLIQLLQRKFFEKNDSLLEYSFRLFTTSQFTGTISQHVTLFLYRVDVDQTRRHVDLPRMIPGHPTRFALGLELRYLLTVWGGTAEAEHEILSDCIAILDEHAVVTGDLLIPEDAWQDGDALKVSLESITNEDMLRLWDSLEPSYQLSVPYLVRTVRLQGAERKDPSIVHERENRYVPRLPPRALR